jgi:hypothetical protein
VRTKQKHAYDCNRVPSFSQFDPKDSLHVLNKQEQFLDELNNQQVQIERKIQVTN